MDGRIIIHVDIDYFFAQAEEQRNSSLKGKPLVVCVYSARGKDSGAVGTSNYEARNLGIKSGMPISFAKKKADKNTTFLAADMNYYKDVSSKVIQAAKVFADTFEQASIDEAFLDVSKKAQKDFINAQKIAEKLKKEIFEKFGLTCSVGIAPNKLVAKIASGTKKPNGLAVVRQRELKKFLNPLAVSEIPGVGKKTMQELERMNVKTIKDLAGTNPLNLIEIFGNAKGKFLHNASLGIDESPIKEGYESQQISRITTLKKDSNDFNEVSKVIPTLSKNIISRLKKEKKFFKTVSIIPITTEIKTLSKSKTLQKFSHDEKELVNTSMNLLIQFLKENPKIMLRRFGVRVTNFSKEEKQKTLGDF